MAQVSTGKSVIEEDKHMTIELTPQLIITVGSVLTAGAAILGALARTIRWMDRQKQQDAEIAALREHHTRDQNRVNTELSLLTYGVLACLKGLKEQGCNGPVTAAIDKIEKHLNLKAHERGSKSLP